MNKKIQIAVSALSSDSGKTLIACGLLEILKRKGLNPCAFKTGPDYIDPMFHRSILGVSSRNLDLVMSDEAYVRESYVRELGEHGSSVIEGVMGMYDGLSGKTDIGSCWHLADTLDVPVLLVVSPRGSSLTVAAEVKGMAAFRQNSHIAGIFLNRCKKMYAGMMKEILEKETGIPVIGSLQEIPDIRVKSRHLGLYQADEIEDLQQNIGKAADAMEAALDWEKLEEVFSVEAPDSETAETPETAASEKDIAGSEASKADSRAAHSSFPAFNFARGEKRAVIAVARDEAFSFCYRETEEEIDRRGGEIVYFSPIHEPCVPEDADAVYLPGGYPELYARELSENRSMRGSMRTEIRNGLPVIAECGGFLYLLESLTDADGKTWPMAGVFPGGSRNSGRLVRFGYADMKAESDSLLMRRGETMRIHEFHYWEADEEGSEFSLKKPLSTRSYAEGYAGKTWYAGFPHLYLAAHPESVERFIDAAEEYRRSRGQVL